jgi:hypothetical protein
MKFEFVVRTLQNRKEGERKKEREQGGIQSRKRKKE